MGNWIDHWWALALAVIGVIITGWRAARKVFRVADAILGYETDGRRVPGVAERVETLESDNVALRAEIHAMRDELQELKRIVSVQFPDA